MNKSFRNWRRVIQEVLDDCQEKRIEPTTGFVKQSVLDKMSPKKENQKTLLEYHQEFLNYYEKEYKKNTWKNHKSVNSHLKAVLANGFKPCDVGIGMYDNLIEYFEEGDMANNSMGKYIKDLTTFLNWLTNKEDNVLHPRQFKGFKKPSNRKNILYFTKQEFKSFVNVDLNGDATAEYSRDLALF